MSLNKILSSKSSSIILIAVILLLNLPNLATATIKEATATSDKFDQKLRLRVDYVINGPGDYRINSTRGCGWGYGWYMAEIYLYVYSDYPTANWYEFLAANIGYDIFGNPRCGSGTIPFWWYWNRAGNDVAVLYADSYLYAPDGKFDWNVALTLP